MYKVTLMKINLLILFTLLQFLVASCDSKRVELEPIETETIDEIKDEVIEDLSQKTIFVPYYNSEIEYQGRIDSTSINAVKLFWSSSSVKLNFEGTSIKALLQDENFDTFYTVLVDNEPQYTTQPDSLENFLTLAENLSSGKHSIELHRNSEWTRGTTIFKGFEIFGNPNVMPKGPEANRKMEFYGNSVTAGASVHDLSGEDSPDGNLTDSYKSYASITARHFGAENSLICRGGIGLMVSWFDQIMPELYNKQDPFIEESEWNFSSYQPDVVVVNLFQNDSWIVNHQTEHPQYIRAFGDTPPTEEFIINAYQNFIMNLRQKYPNADIVCMLGNMDVTFTDEWPNYVRQAVTLLEDDKIHAHFVSFKGTGGHPSVEEHQIMAESLIGYIEENIDW